MRYLLVFVAIVGIGCGSGESAPADQSPDGNQQSTQGGPANAQGELEGEPIAGVRGAGDYMLVYPIPTGWTASDSRMEGGALRTLVQSATPIEGDPVIQLDLVSTDAAEYSAYVDSFLAFVGSNHADGDVTELEGVSVGDMSFELHRVVDVSKSYFAISAFAERPTRTVYASLMALSEDALDAHTDLFRKFLSGFDYETTGESS